MKLFVRTALAALTLGLTAVPAVAQDIKPMSDGPARQGFYLGLGIATASVSADCTNCGDADGASMFGSHIKLGGTLSKSVRLGADLFGVTTSDGIAADLLGTGSTDVTETAGHLMLALTVYPNSASNFWFQAGLGGVVYQADVDGDQKYTGRSPGAMLGVGYDFRVGRNGSITPYVSLTTSGNGHLYDENGDEVPGGEKWQTAFFALGVDYIFH